MGLHPITFKAHTATTMMTLLCASTWEFISIRNSFHSKLINFETGLSMCTYRVLFLSILIHVTFSIVFVKFIKGGILIISLHCVIVISCYLRRLSSQFGISSIVGAQVPPYSYYSCYVVCWLVNVVFQAQDDRLLRFPLTLDLQIEDTVNSNGTWFDHSLLAWLLYSLNYWTQSHAISRV